jgi:hypothetical protein
VGLRFAITFALLITIGQVFAYRRGMRPAIDYVAADILGLPDVSSGALWSEPSAT